MPVDINTTLMPLLRDLNITDDDANIQLTALSGGVSSDIYRLNVNGVDYCLKQALPKLKVSAEWLADTERSYYEAEWLRFAHSINNTCTPAILAYDSQNGIILMEYLPPGQYPVWKTQLMDGIIDVDFAGRVGKETGLLHAHACDFPRLSDSFRTGSMFHQLRIEPYLQFTAEKYKDHAVSGELLDLVNMLDRTRITLIHGDVSPKNILCGPYGPVFLDAECAFYGDPAFDLSFCLNHLLLKSVWNPELQQHYIEAYNRLAASYLDCITWESRTDFSSRCVKLLPALMLARVDGKSPVEYITSEQQKEFIRGFSIAKLCRPSTDLFDLAGELSLETAEMRR